MNKPISIILLVCLLVLVLPSSASARVRIPPSWQWFQLSTLWRVATGSLNGTYVYLDFTSASVAREALGNIAGARSVYKATFTGLPFEGVALSFEGVMIPLAISDMVVNGSLRLQHMNEGATIVNNAQGFTIYDASGPSPQVQQIVVNKDHANTKHQLAIDVRQSALNGGCYAMEFWYERSSGRFLTLCQLTQSYDAEWGGWIVYATSNRGENLLSPVREATCFVESRAYWDWVLKRDNYVDGHNYPDVLNHTRNELGL